MKWTGTNFKQVTAALLLGIFVFILAEKSRHGHHYASSHISDSRETVSSLYHCLVCDFQLAAGADLPTGPTVPVYAAIDRLYQSFDLATGLTRYLAPFQERGPPSLGCRQTAM